MDDAPTDENPTGVRTFNHSDLAQLPGYHAVASSLDRLVRSVRESQQQDELVMLNQADFIDLASNVARSIAFADNCGACERANPPERYDPVFPAVVELDGRGGLNAGYICYRCGHRWQTWWALEHPEF
jgi:hypothetical protein